MDDKAPFLDMPQYAPDNVIKPQDLQPNVLSHSTNPAKTHKVNRDQVLQQVNYAKR